MAKFSLWGNLGQILLAVGTSYLSAKISNKETGWVNGGYRDELISNTASVVIGTAIQQVSNMQQKEEINVENNTLQK